eukprot:snap_masked-scaffold_39-processed-gene-1.53-mRNA-1 protein AED:1.00 eAED:1.00 QI:0/0/0/0/1/1/3/0/74
MYIKKLILFGRVFYFHAKVLGPHTSNKHQIINKRAVISCKPQSEFGVCFISKLRVLNYIMKATPVLFVRLVVYT